LAANETPKENRFDEKVWDGLLRLGGFSLLASGFALVLGTLMSLFLSTTVVTSQFETIIGIPPIGLENVTGYRLALSVLPNSTFATNADYVSAHATSFEIVFLLNALTFVFLIPGILALYVSLRAHGRAPASVGLAFAISAVVLGLTYVPSAFATIRMEQLYTTATSDAVRSGFFGAALASGDALNGGSTLSTLLLNGVLVLVGYLMTKDAVFGRNLGYLGIFAGSVGIATSFLPYPLSIAGSVLSLFALAWIFLSGVRLIRLPERSALRYAAPPAFKIFEDTVDEDIGALDALAWIQM
jgi:hypothetical protein